ncbi:MAG: DNA-directed DNA polymerase II small subunit [Nanoarchaeota archaeon]|nr:MAG: DNA-directed DNA polymerase II small subunit [Nanoarchaeota archaeon]
MTLKNTIEKLIKEGILVSPELLEEIDSIHEIKLPDDVAVLNKDVLRADSAINLNELETTRARVEKNKDSNAYRALRSEIEAEEQELAPLKIVFSYDKAPRKRSPKDFTSFFLSRYSQLERILKGRNELRNVVSIGRLSGQKETVSIIGMVREKQLTKNHNIILTVEDMTGQIKAIVTKNKTAIFGQAKDIVEDSVIGIVGVTAEKAMFVNSILLPDVPMDKLLMKSPEKGYAAIISDIHVGSAKFMPEEFNKFIRWLNGEIGSEAQKEMSRQIKYMFIVGDIVDGVGVYPGQKKELAITDIVEQYTEAARLLSQVPKRIRMIICPGNHDSMRLSEPQPAFNEEFCKPLRDALPDAVFVSNPSVINIAETKNFPGIDVLLYHGYSFDYYVAEVDSIRNSGGYDRADLIMKFLLQHRHLAPSYGSTLFLPDPQKDNLVIEKVPDIFASGHIHKTSVSNYRNVTLICGSCWQDKTLFQEKMGHHPEPARVPLVNLQTREVKVLKFV